MSENQIKEKRKSFVGGAAVLGIAGLITKLLGAFFRIPLTNIIGDSGMGYYQTAYPVYVFLLMISTSGLPTAISRMVAERRAQERYYEAHRVFKLSFVIMASIGIVTSLSLFIFAPAICAYQLEPDAVYAMRATAPALLFCPIMSCFRGFFQGRRTMTPTAVSQVVEQFFRVGLGLSLAYILLKMGDQYAAAGASFGATAGSFFGLIAVAFVYWKHRSVIEGEYLGDRTSYQTTGEIFREILVIAVPVTLGSAIMPILNSIDTLIVKRRLMSIGYDSNVARSMFGQLSGMASPIINFPMVFSQAVCMSIVPVITDAFKRGDKDFLRKNASLGLRYAFLIMLPCACGMIVLAEPIMKLLYPRQPESAVAAAGCLRIYAIGMIFLAAIQALTGILQGIGKQNIPVLNLLVGAVVKIAATYILTGIPSINIRGAAIGTALAYFVAASLNYRAVVKYTETRMDVGLTVVKPLISSLVMGAVAGLVYKVLIAGCRNFVACVCAIISGVVVYAVMVFISGTIRGEDIDAIPKLAKVGRILRKLKLIK